MRYSIADHIVQINFEDTVATTDTISSFKSFEINEGCGQPLLSVTINDNYSSYPKEQLRLVRNVDTGNGIIRVMRHTVDGIDIGYQFIIKDIFGYSCALLKADKNFQDCRCALRGDKNKASFGLNSVMMLSYAFATSKYDTILVHASMVRHNGEAYAFIAESGTGKSTQVSNWLRYIPDCDLMNDDNPIFRIQEGKVIAYGSPWSGKTPCYRNVSAPLKGIAKIVRDKDNHIERQNVITSYAEVFTSCSSMKWDKQIYKCVSGTSSKIIAKVPVFHLHCLPDSDSARVALKGMI